MEKENLAQEYNIYVFHGTDGMTGIRQVKNSAELNKMMDYASRIGITIASHAYAANEKTEVQAYLENSGLLEERSDLLRMDVMSEDASEARLIEGIRKLISHEIPV